jgi:hypothetical protein
VSPESIREPEKRQTAPIPIEIIKMGTSTKVEVQTETTQGEGSNKGKQPQRSNLRALMDKAMKRGGPPDEEPKNPHGGDDDDNNFYEAFSIAHTTGSDRKILGNLPSAFNRDRARAEEFLMNMKAYFRLNIKNSQL